MSDPGPIPIYKMTGQQVVARLEELLELKRAYPVKSAALDSTETKYYQGQMSAAREKTPGQPIWKKLTGLWSGVGVTVGALAALGTVAAATPVGALLIPAAAYLAVGAGIIGTEVVRHRERVRREVKAMEVVLQSTDLSKRIGRVLDGPDPYSPEIRGLIVAINERTGSNLAALASEEYVAAILKDHRVQELALQTTAPEVQSRSVEPVINTLDFGGMSR